MPRATKWYHSPEHAHSAGVLRYTENGYNTADMRRLWVVCYEAPNYNYYWDEANLGWMTEDVQALSNHALAVDLVKNRLPAYFARQFFWKIDIRKVKIKNLYDVWRPNGRV